MNTKKILVTLGPSSLKENVIKELEKEDIYLFRINLSHTPIDEVAITINTIRKYSNVPICLDSEGAQIRNQKIIGGETLLVEGDIVKIHFDEILGDSNNISFTPLGIAKEFVEGDEISIDFNSASIKIFEKNTDHCLAKVIVGGKIGNSKAANINREIGLESITPKDKQAISIGLEMGIKNFALSFAGSPEDVNNFKNLTGPNAKVISKIESHRGLLNLIGIIKESDEILIDRGDLSREISLEKIPFLQRNIIASATALGKPVYIATNLLESMLHSVEPTRAEINDVVCSLRMGGDGLVLAAETAVGKFPVESVRITRKLINQFYKWTPNSSIEDILK